MTTAGQAPVAEAAERSHLALRRAVLDVAMSLARTEVRGRIPGRYFVRPDRLLHRVDGRHKWYTVREH